MPAAINGPAGASGRRRRPAVATRRLRARLAAALDPAVRGGQPGREQAEAVRLLGMARELGNQIRSHLQVDDVVREAATAIRQHIGADAVWVFLVEDGRPSPPVAGQYAPLLPESYSETVPPGSTGYLEGMYRRGESIVLDDLRGPGGGWIAPEIRDPLLAAGVITHMLTPFGIGATMLGFMTVERLELRPWLPAEVDTVELVAADIGRAVHHARLFEQEARLVAELREVDRAKSDFLAAVSHELRTPLASIVGYLEVLRDREAGPLTGTQEQMLTSVDRSAVRLRRLIEDMLTLSRIEAGTFRSRRAPVSMSEVVRKAAAALRPVAGKRGIALTADCPPEGLPVSGDPGQLDRVLMDLISNAVKFSPDGGRVEITAVPAPDARDGMVEVTVRDSGIGIPEAEQRHLGDRFFRGSNAVAGAVPGTGMGLAITHTIVANHRGSLNLTSREGEGTTAVLTLPALRPA